MKPNAMAGNQKTTNPFGKPKKTKPRLAETTKPFWKPKKTKNRLVPNWLFWFLLISELSPPNNQFYRPYDGIRIKIRIYERMGTSNMKYIVIEWTQR